MEGDLFSDSVLDTVEKKSPKLYDALNIRGIHAVMIVRVGIGDNAYGYLICAEMHNQRLWQENECGIVYFLAKLLAAAN